jgi:LPXTG-motif cell wall-anchored protein
MAAVAFVFLIPIPFHILPWYAWIGLIVVLFAGLGIVDRKRRGL